MPKHLSADAPPGVLFRVRTWTLECLLRLDELDHDGFWNQAVIFASMYAKAVKSEAETADACRAVSASFAALVRVVQARDDAGAFIGAKTFAAFGQRWMQYAKKISDLDTLNHISRLMDVTSIAASGGADKIMAKISVAALQAAELMERFPASLQDPSLPDHLHRVSGLLRTLISHSSSHPPPVDALTKLRRVAVDTADLWTGSNAELRAAVVGALSGVIECVERWKLDGMINGSIDALVVLARAAMQDGQAGIQHAYAHLERAVRISRARHEQQLAEEEQDKENSGAKDVNTKPANAKDVNTELANRLRVISAAFYLHGGALYRDAAYGHAALFLKTSADTAREALDTVPSSSAGLDAWKDLREQLGKRLELHGVCCVKFGDRKVCSFRRPRHLAENSIGRT